MAHLLLQAVLIFAVFGALNCAPPSSPAPLGAGHVGSLSSKESKEEDKNHHLAGPQGRTSRDAPAPSGSHDHSHHDSSSSEESKESKEHDKHYLATGQQGRVARDTAQPVANISYKHQRVARDTAHPAANTSQHQHRVARETPNQPKAQGEHDHSPDLHRVPLQSQPLSDVLVHGAQTAPKQKRFADHEGKSHEDDHAHSHPEPAVPAVLRQPANPKPVDQTHPRTARATEEKQEHSDEKEAGTQTSSVHIQPVAHPAVQPIPILARDPVPAGRQARDTSDSSTTPQQPSHQQHSDNPQVQRELTVPNHESEYNRHVRDSDKASTHLDPQRPVLKPQEGPKSDEHKHDHH